VRELGEHLADADAAGWPAKTVCGPARGNSHGVSTGAGGVDPAIKDVSTTVACVVVEPRLRGPSSDLRRKRVGTLAQSIDQSRRVSLAKVPDFRSGRETHTDGGAMCGRRTERLWCREQVDDKGTSKHAATEEDASASSSASASRA
jgi:hypothetical protein